MRKLMKNFGRWLAKMKHRYPYIWEKLASDRGGAFEKKGEKSEESGDSGEIVGYFWGV